MEPSVLSGWRLSAGDPTWIGWATTIAYLAGAAACWRAGHSTVGQPETAEGSDRPWLALALLLLGLGLNKQLDLQTPFLAILRNLTSGLGWRRQSRIIDSILTGSAVLALLLLTGIVLRWRRFMVKHPLVPAGMALSALYVLVRIAHFGHVDESLGRRTTGQRIGVYVEFLGAALLALGAGLRMSRSAGPE